MRFAVALVMGLALPLMAGCAAHTECRGVRVRTVPDQRPAELASALLFDARPGAYDAQEFAARSDWPSTPAFYSPGQVIFFNDWMVDYQGSNLGNTLDTFRRAESLRIGVGYR